LAYVNSFFGVFMFDDLAALVRPPGLRDFATAISNTSRLLVGLTFLANWKLGGLRVADYHLVNMVIHIAAGMFLFGIVRRTLMLPIIPDRYKSSASQLGFVIAAIWLVHPLQTESVTYISQRSESLMGLLYFATLYCFVAGVQSGENSRWYTASIVACAAGMAVKPVMITAPLMVLLYDRCLLSGGIMNALRTRRSVYLGLAATWLVPAALLLAVVNALKVMGYSSGLPSSRLTYLLTEQGVVLHYLKLVFWPYHLCLDYGWPAALTVREALLPGAVIAILLAVTLWACYRRHPVGFCGLWFFVIIAPSSTILPIDDFAAEHRLYLPLAGIVAAVVVAAYELLRKWTRPWLPVVLACSLVVVLGVATHQRNKDYYSEEAMWRSVVETSPANLRARNDYAVTLSQAGKVREALAQYEAVLDQIPPKTRLALDSRKVRMIGTVMPNSYEYNYFRAHSNMGLLFQKELGRNAEAVGHYAAALSVIPFVEDVRWNMRMALKSCGVADGDMFVVMERTIRTGKVDDWTGK
jgi:tetratricopeptide (TPR) repeat protein